MKASLLPGKGLRWQVLAATLVLVVLWALLIDVRVGSALGLINFKPHFSDWIAILAAGEAQRAGADIYALPNPFDPFGRPHVYGPWWPLLGHLGFTTGDYRWMGLALAFLFVLVVVAVLRPSSPASTALAVGILLSPPVMLGLERANNDLVIFLLLACASWSAARWPRIGIWPAVGVISLAAALKIYPIAALAALPAAPCQPRKVWQAGLAGIAFCAACAAWYWADYSRALALAPREVSIFTYGFTIFTQLARTALNGIVALGIAAGLGLGAWLAFQWQNLWAHVPLHGRLAFSFVAGAACWVFCYFANTNFPYRAVLLLLPAGFWLQRWNDRTYGVVSRRCFTLLLLMLWMACATGHAQEWVDRSGESLVPLLLVLASLEQTLALVITTALVVSLTGWATRHWRSKGALPRPAET